MWNRICETCGTLTGTNKGNNLNEQHPCGIGTKESNLLSKIYTSAFGEQIYSEFAISSIQLECVAGFGWAEMLPKCPLVVPQKVSGLCIHEAIPFLGPAPQEKCPGKFHRELAWLLRHRELAWVAFWWCIVAKRERRKAEGQCSNQFAVEHVHSSRVCQTRWGRKSACKNWQQGCGEFPVWGRRLKNSARWVPMLGASIKQHWARNYCQWKAPQFPLSSSSLCLMIG